MLSAQPANIDAIVEHRRDGFLLSTEPARLDLNVIHGFLTTSYWAKGIPREVVARSIEHSLCFGIYDERGEKSPFLPNAGKNGALQVGFARVISDFATIAYIADVFVLESYRGRGLSKWMMLCITSHPALQGLRRLLLRTRDAHGLYAQSGFTSLKQPERYMERQIQGVYENPGAYEKEMP